MKISTSSSILLVIIVSMILGLILRLLLVVTLPTTWDGGTFFYWANLVNSGDIPYRNFFVRDPVYIYLIAISIRIFGISVPALSLASIVPSILTVPVLYRISREIFDRLTGLVSALIFSFAPTVVWYSTVFDERSLMLFLSVLGMWALVRSLKTGNSRFLVLFGLITGVGTFAYRALAIYAVALPLFLVLLNRRSGFSVQDVSKRLVIGTILSWGSFLIAFGSIFLLFSTTSSFNWMVSNFGFSGQAESAGSFIGAQTSISFKDRIFYVAVREWLYLLVPALVFTVVILFRKLSNRLNLALGITMIGVAAFLVATLAWRTADPQSSFGAYDPSSAYLYTFLAFLVILPGIAAVEYRRTSRPLSYKGPIPMGWALLIFWFMSTVVLIALFGAPLVNYYYYFAPSLTLLASPMIAQAIRQISSSTNRPLSRS
jgi:4-amino-4-deoxy-L-arabinose transferase-like glycosyltransferase